MTTIIKTLTPTKKNDYHLSIDKTPVVYITERKDGRYEVETTSKKLTKVFYAFSDLLNIPIEREKSPGTLSSHFIVLVVKEQATAVRLATAALIAQQNHKTYYSETWR